MKLIALISFTLFILLSFAQDDPALTFEPIGGVYEKATTVTISAAEGASIYYTLDGTAPSSRSIRYRGPITVKDVKLIRAVAYQSGRKSNIYTHTYICDRAYDLPVVSVATDTANLWSFETGIFVKGCCADTIEPYMGANYWKSWEKHANIEMYDTEGKLCFNQAAGISIFGGFSRMLPMKSLAVIARPKYGDKRFRYPIFPGREHDKYKSFILRNSGGDFRRTHLRDAFMTQLAKPTGIAIQEYQPAVVFINGKYWGIQNMREKINEHYLHQNYDVDKDQVDILRQDKVARHGNSKEYRKLIRWLEKHDLSDDGNVAVLDSFFDIDLYLAYNIAEVYSDNRDAGGNIRYFKERNDTSKWKWVYYDIDQGLGNNARKGYKRNTLKKFTSLNHEAWPDPPWSTFIIRKLLENKEIQRKYINTFADHLNTYYHPQTAHALLDSMVNLIEYEMDFHQARWKSSVKNWHYHLDIVRDFISNRPHYCRMHIMEKFGLEDTVAVSIVHPGKEKCKITFNSLKIKSHFQGIYFKDVPVEIKIKPKQDYELIGWKDADTKDLSRMINPSGNIVLEPIIQPKKRSVYTDQVFFNEIAFYQPATDTSEDWLELYNNTDQTVDLSNWVLTDDKFKDGWVFPEDTKMGPREFLVIAEKPDNFKSKFDGDSSRVIGGMEFGFSSKGERLKLYDAEGLIVDSLTYTRYCLTEDPDTAYTLALAHPDSSASDLHWNLEPPSPGWHNKGYKDFLQLEADKKYWTRIFFIGGGGFFFISAAGIIFYRFFRKRRRNVQKG